MAAIAPSARAAGRAVSIGSGGDRCRSAWRPGRSSRTRRRLRRRPSRSRSRRSPARADPPRPAGPTIRLESMPPDSSSRPARRRPCGARPPCAATPASRPASRARTSRRAPDAGELRVPVDGLGAACRRARSRAPSPAAASAHRAGSCAARGTTGGRSGNGAARPGRSRCRRRRRPAAPAACEANRSRARRLSEVQRLDPQSVAGQHQPPAVALDDREGEHALRWSTKSAPHRR